MIKKIFLALFGLFIIAQAIGVFAWGTYLRSQAKPELISEEFPSRILVDSKGQLWLQPWADSNSQDFRLEVYKDGSLVQTFHSKNEPNFPSQIAMDSQGNLFGVVEIGSSEIRVVMNEGSSWNELTTFTREYAPPVNAFVVGSRDDIWIGGIGELIHYDGSEWKIFTPDNSPLPRGWIYTLFIDSQKRIWIGTGSGIAMIDNGNFQTLTDSAPNSGTTIYSFAESSNGTIWAGGTGGMYSYDGSLWNTYNGENSKLRGSQINDIEVDSSDRVWALSSAGSDLSVWDGTTMRYVFATPGNSIKDIEIGLDGTLYMMRTDDASMLRTDVPLIDPSSLKFLWLSNNGIFIYLSIFLVTIWIALAMNSWGVGLGPALGGLIYWGLEAFSLFDINGVSLGYINPGFALTIFTFIGGLIGYLIKRRGTKYADLIGGGVGCFGGGVLLACVFAVFMMALIAITP